jgi:plastocyanin
MSLRKVAYGRYARGGGVLVASALLAAGVVYWGVPGPTFWTPHLGGRLSPPPTAEQLSLPAAGASTVRVTLVEFAFRPNEIRMKGWQPTNLEMVNDGVLLHAVVIPKLGVRITLKPGERRAVRLDWLKTGTYQFFCSIPGHREAGMIGRLVVSPSYGKMPL